MLVPSLLAHSREPFELIFIDIGSLDGTADYLAGLAAGARSIRVAAVRTETDLGINDACREALDTARGEYIVLLNNDTIVTDSWLNQLIGLANLSPAIGLVDPMSNYAAPPQLVEVVPYRVAVSGQLSAASDQRSADFSQSRHSRGGVDAWLTADRYPLTAIDTFANDWREKQRGKWLEVERLGGFCLLMKRQVLAKIGTELGREADLGLFDTDILSSHARAAGFTLAVCRDLFIHHFGADLRTRSGVSPPSHCKVTNSPFDRVNALCAWDCSDNQVCKRVTRFSLQWQLISPTRFRATARFCEFKRHETRSAARW
jgi:GT2 family glycosyltransferase